MPSGIISPQPWKHVKRNKSVDNERPQGGKGGYSHKADGANVSMNRNPSGSQYEPGTSGRGKGPNRNSVSGDAMAYDKFVSHIAAHPARKGRNPQGSKDSVKLTNSEPKKRGVGRYRPGMGNR